MLGTCLELSNSKMYCCKSELWRQIITFRKWRHITICSTRGRATNNGESLHRWGHVWDIFGCYNNMPWPKAAYRRKSLSRLIIPKGEPIMAVGWGHDSREPEQKAERSHLQSQMWRRESELELRGAYKHSKPSPNNWLPPAGLVL